MAISPQRVIRSTSYLVLGQGFHGLWIEWRYFRFDQILNGSRPQSRKITVATRRFLATARLSCLFTLQRNSCLLSFNGTLIIHDYLQAVNLLKFTNTFSSRPTKQLLLPQSSLSGVYSFLKMYSHRASSTPYGLYDVQRRTSSRPPPREKISCR